MVIASLQLHGEWKEKYLNYKVLIIQYCNYGFLFCSCQTKGHGYDIRIVYNTRIRIPSYDIFFLNFVVVVLAEPPYNIF